ncbi:hypothetical protein ABPG72_007862 [Tetrahymena utriculariae]
MEESLKTKNGFGYTFYQVKRAIYLNKSTLIKEYEIYIQRNITYVSGHEYLNGDSQAILKKDTVGSKLNYIHYVGTLSGLVFSSWCQQSRYQKLSTQNILKLSNGLFQEIIQSAQIGMYFLRTNQQIASFQAYNNTFIE